MTHPSRAVRVEPMLPHEAEAVAGLIRTIISPLPYYNEQARKGEIAKHTAQDLKRAIAADPLSVAVARLDGRMVGFSVTRFDDFLIWIAWLGVLPEARRSGVARAILADIDRTAALRGCHKIWADSRTDNPAMARLFPESGYQRVATFERHWYGQDFFFWQKFVGG